MTFGGHSSKRCTSSVGHIAVFSLPFLSKQKCLSGRKFRSKGKRILRLDRKIPTTQHMSYFLFLYTESSSNVSVGCEKPVPNERCVFSPAMLFELICLGAEDVNWEAQSEDVEDEAAGTSAETENEQDSSGELGSIFNLSVIKSFNFITRPLELTIKVKENLEVYQWQGCAFTKTSLPARSKLAKINLELTQRYILQFRQRSRHVVSRLSAHFNVHSKRARSECIAGASC